MAKNSPVKKTKAKIPGWVTYLVVGAIILSVLVIAFWVLIFLGLTKYSQELKKAGFSFDPYKKSLNLKNQKTGEEISVGEQTGLPKALANFPAYPNARIVLKVESDTNPSVTLSTSDGSKKIYQWYLLELPKKGWTVTEQSSFLIEVKNKSYKGSVALIQLDSGTTITITLNRNKTY